MHLSRWSLSLLGGVGLIAGLLATAAGPALASPRAAPPSAFTCTSGAIPAGTYTSITVAGICSAPAGQIVDLGDLTVQAGALLDAVTPGDPTGAPVLPAWVLIGGNVTVEAGGVFLLGCSPNISCTNPPAIGYDVIGGDLTTVSAQAVVVHSAEIEGSVNITGGGGDATCKAQKPGHPINKSLEPWSEDPALDFIPVYTDFEDNTIGGSLDISGVDSCWMGSLRNIVSGSASFTSNTMGDPDANEVANNLISGSLDCDNNLPAVQFGDSGAAPNIVTKAASGECAFGVTQPNPAPESGRTGIPEDIAVHASDLGKYKGTQKSVAKVTIDPIATSSGITVTGRLGDFYLTGNGLVGQGLFNPKKKPGSTGEAVLFSVYPNGSAQFTAYETCNCSFGGQTGKISIRVYGAQNKAGDTGGTFLITSGGGRVPGSLSTLAGYGTFWQKNGQKPVITEYLANT